MGDVLTIQHHNNVSCYEPFYSEELYALYCSPNFVWVNEMGGACSAYGGEEKVYTGFCGET
jgi:hypothetical protein